MLQVTIAIYTTLLLVATQAQANPLQDSVDSFLANKAAVSVDNPGATAMVCLAAHSLIPSAGNRAINFARYAGSSLLESMTKGNDRAGWTLGTYTLPANCGPGTYRPFGRTECNPKDTFYAYYNALAILCLSRLGNTFDDSRFSEAAQASVAYWLKIGARSNDCQKCWYFWTSDVSADRITYVRDFCCLLGCAVV